MKLKKIGLLFVLFWSHYTSHAGIFDAYLQPFKTVMSDCSIDYKMKCAYPDGTTLNIVGVMAVKGNKYYDSSNTRHVVLNDSWYIIADHIEKEISVASIKDVNIQLQDIGAFTATSFLLNDDLDNINIKLIKQNSDTVWVGLTSVSNTIEYMEIAVLTKSLIPVQYRAKINYSLGADYEMADGSVAPGLIKLDIECYNIKAGANDKLFDHSSIIVRNGDKGTLKRYKNYKVQN